MEVQLLPKDSNRVDYTTYESGIIYRQYRFGDHLFHFTLHPELYPDETGLDFTGRYLAVFTSVRGLESFYLGPDGEGSFVVDNEEEMDYEDASNDPQLSKNVQNLLQEANIQPPQEEETEELTSEQLKGIEWLQFDPEKELLTLMIQAIEEFRNQ